MKRTRHYRHTSRNQGNIFDGNLYSDTGIFEEHFLELFSKVKHLITCKRAPGPTLIQTTTTLEPMSRLRLVMTWLRHNERHEALARQFGVSRSQVSREISHILPAIYVSINEISWPERPIFHWFENLVGAIDCTSHFRWRVHPRQSDYYCADKHAFFISTKVVCSITGEIWNVVLGKGHNNDKALFNISGMKQKLENLNQKLAADRGYSHRLLITPNDFKDRDWNNKQKGIRSVVETSIGLVKLFATASERFRQNPEIQELAIMISYQLTNRILKDYPLRFSYF